jgi:hypothetical protein
MNRFAFFFLASFFALLVACGSSSTTTPASVVNPGSTLSFTPSQVTAVRLPAGCGVMNPPYTDNDVFELSVAGSTAQKPPTDLFLALERTVTVGSPLSLAPMAVQTNPGPPASARMQTAATPDGVATFSFSWGADASEIDPNTLASVTLTVEAFPAKDGDLLTVRCVLTFTDSKTLDMTFSSATLSGFSGCAAG